MRNDDNREINNHGELIKIEAIREEGEEKKGTSEQASGFLRAFRREFFFSLF